MKPIVLGYWEGKRWKQARAVFDGGGLSIAITTTPFFMGNVLEGDKDMGKLRIRKLTEGECYRLMGFEKKDTEACRAAGQSKANLFHQSGDSIVTTVLVGIFGELLDLDYKKAIGDYCDKLHGEVK